jgi:DNA/RNA endonuclease YhcR with UshA esterase domain
MMKKHVRVLIYLAVLICFSLFVPSDLLAQNFITPADVSKHIGQTKTVCGKVASTFYSVRSKGQPTFINLDQAYPNQIFTIVIWGSDRVKFKNSPETFFKDKSVCVTGKIDTYKGRPEIIVRDPSQIIAKKD